MFGTDMQDHWVVVTKTVNVPSLHFSHQVGGMVFGNHQFQGILNVFRSMAFNYLVLVM